MYLDVLGLFRRILKTFWGMLCAVRWRFNVYTLVEPHLPREARFSCDSRTSRLIFPDGRQTRTRFGPGDDGKHGR